jgi:cell division protein FtsB
MKTRTVKLRFKLLLLTVFLAFAGISIYRQQANINSLLAEQQTLSAQYEQAQLELQRLQDQSDYMNTEDYIEDTARERLGYAYQDEIVLPAPSDNPN